MILFANDWLRYPYAKPHFETTNKSWVELAKLYHYMGIKNHMFPLAIHNQALRDVDPFDPDLSLQTQLDIAFECKINPWYYFREVARIPGHSGEDAIPMDANRGNVALLWCFFNHITTVLIQIRQTGKSVTVDELVTYLLNVRCRKTDINLLTKDDVLRSKNIKRLKDIDIELPAYLKQRTKADLNNTEQLTIRSLGNTLTAHVPQASPKAADKVGRGLTSPIFLIDEGPFQPNVHISVPAALSAGNNARMRAARNGEPYGTIFTTTAGKKDTKEGEYMYKLTSGAAAWREAFLDAQDIEQLESIVRGSSRSKELRSRGAFRINITLNHKQLGYDDDWLYKTIEDVEAEDDAQIDRDFFNRWTSGSLTSPLGVEVMERIRASECEPNYVEISKNNYLTNWYVPQEMIDRQLASGIHILSMDTSEASGGDDISLIVTEITTGRVIATGTYNETNFITFSIWIASWFERFPNLRAIIERRSTGSALIDQLLLLLPSAGIDPFKVLFNRVVQEAEDDPDRYKEIQVPFERRPLDIYTRFKKHFGYATSGTGEYSRTELYSGALQSAAKLTGESIHDKTTIDQLLSLVIRNGRIDHPPGEHDDMVIAFLLQHWWLTKGKNLSFYGIRSDYVLAAAKRKNAPSGVSQYDAAKQMEYREQIKILMEQLRSAEDDYISARIERDIRFLDSRIEHTTEETLSIDELIRQTREKRRARKQNQANNYLQGYSGGYGRHLPTSMHTHSVYSQTPF